MSVRTFAVLHTAMESDPEQVVELERLELRAAFIDHNVPLVFGGQLYVPAPLHLRRTERPMVNTAEVLELPYHLVPVYDVDFDEIAPRLYTPAEANELVERVREPLDQLVQAVNLLAEQNGKLSAEQVVAGRKALINATRVLAELAPVDDCPGEPLDAPGSEETPCPKREDGTHCVHWWDGDHPCCACGDNSQASGE